jgi:hypothetical protein
VAAFFKKPAMSKPTKKSFENFKLAHYPSAPYLWCEELRNKVEVDGVRELRGR